MSKTPLWKNLLIIAGITLSPAILLSAESLTLNDALSEAIQNNISLQIRETDQGLSEQDVQIAESAFDTTLFGGVSFSENEQGSVSTSESKSGSLGLSKSFSTGTAVTVQTSYTGNSGSRFSSDLNQFVGGTDNHNSRLNVSIRQPLLKGFGRSANMANIWKAESQLEVSKLDYTNLLMDVVNRTENAYWYLSVQNANLELSKTSIELAESLLKETEERAEVGLATPLDVLQAKANLASKNETYIVAQKTFQDALDDLFIYMGRLNPEMEEIETTVSALPEPEAVRPSLSVVWGGALKTDLDTKIQKTQIESLAYDKAIYKDRLKTKLDLILSGASTGLSADNLSDSYSRALEKEGYDVGVSLELNVPIGKRSAKASLSKIDIIVDREIMRLKQIEQSLFKEVRRHWRALNVSQEKLKASRATLELEKQAFEQAKTKYSSGLAVFRDVQEAQDSLNRARISELNAWISALQAEANLSRLDGTLLGRLNINVQFE